LFKPGVEVGTSVLDAGACPFAKAEKHGTSAYVPEVGEVPLGPPEVVGGLRRLENFTPGSSGLHGFMISRYWIFRSRLLEVYRYTPVSWDQ